MITLETLPQATEQEVFDQVATHLLTQNEQSSINRGATGEVFCRYRAGDLMCAAGCLIDDNEYNETLEGEGWHGLVQQGIAPKEHETLINSLQEIHDETVVNNWFSELKDLAFNYGLNTNLIDAFNGE